jgi:HD-like signal output (HDOD) protein
MTTLQAAATSTSASESQFDRLVAKARHLYSLPAVAAQVLELTSSPSINTAALKTGIENDPALCGKVLRVVNSSMFGLSRSVTDLNQALALLGVKPLKMLVLGFSLPPALTRNVAADLLLRYWRRTLTKSVAAREVARMLKGVAPDEAYLAGLLQDVGMLTFMQELGESYVKFVEHCNAASEDLVDLELKALGFDHRTLSARMLEAWKLPATFSQAIGQPLLTESIERLSQPQKGLVQSLHLAELIAQTLIDQRPHAMKQLQAIATTYCQLDEDGLQRLIESLQTPLEQVATIMNVRLGPEMECGKLLEFARMRLAETTEEVAFDMLQFDDGGLLKALAETTSIGASAKGSIDAARSVSKETGEASKPRPKSEPGKVDTRPATSSRGPSQLEFDLQNATTLSRSARQPLSLLWAKIDRLEDHAFIRGADGLRQLERTVAMLLRGQAPDATLSIVNDGAFALFATNLDRGAAVELARHLARTVAQWSVHDRTINESSPKATVSIGVATVVLPPRNFPVGQLIDAAKRCATAQQSTGGDGVKSIEIY